MFQIDMAVVSIMSDEELVIYLPHYGDRIAVRNFCHRQLQTPDRKNALLQRLRTKLEAHAEGAHKDEEKSSQTRHAGNRYAEKKKRRIELSLLRKSGDSNLKQVRTKTGGGTRHLTLDKETNMSELLSMAIDVHFADDKSPLGCKSMYTFELLDYRMNETNHTNHTVADIYARSKLKMLKFFLVMSGCDEFGDGEQMSAAADESGESESTYVSTVVCIQHDNVILLGHCFVIHNLP